VEISSLIKLIKLSLTICIVVLFSGCSNVPNPISKTEPYTIGEEVAPSQARKIVVQEAATQLGKPYKISGNSPREGFDCSGLVFYTYLKAGKLLPRRAEDQYLSAHKVHEVKPGDLVFFTTSSKGKHIDHVGIYLGKQQFIHAPGRGKGVATANITESYWQEHYRGAGDYLD
jgi:cell wall-associated NlpC family hydrolase